MIDVTEEAFGAPMKIEYCLHNFERKKVLFERKQYLFPLSAFVPK